MIRSAAFAAIAASLLVGTGLTACAPITSYSGFQAIDADPKTVEVGIDTMSAVRVRLGSPSATSTFDPNVWFYVNQIKERVAFRRPRVTARDITAVVFNKETEIVEKVDNFTLTDGKVIAYNSRETPTRGREMTVLEQLIGSISQGALLPNDVNDPGNRPGGPR